MAEQETVTKSQLLNELEQGWQEIHNYLATLSEDQLTRPTDAAGWSVKDHLAHLAAWEEGVLAALEHGNRAETMGVDAETWASGDYDRMNEVIRRRHQHLSLEETMDYWERVHRRLVARIESMSDADLNRPYRYYQPQSSQEFPIFRSIRGNSAAHYQEHRPWIEAIVRGS